MRRSLETTSLACTSSTASDQGPLLATPEPNPLTVTRHLQRSQHAERCRHPFLHRPSDPTHIQHAAGIVVPLRDPPAGTPLPECVIEQTILAHHPREEP